MDVNAEWPWFDLFLLISRRSVGYQPLPNKRLDQAASARKKPFKERIKVLNRPRIWVKGTRPSSRTFNPVKFSTLANPYQFLTFSDILVLKRDVLI